MKRPMIATALLAVASLSVGCHSKMGTCPGGNCGVSGGGCNDCGVMAGEAVRRAPRTYAVPGPIRTGYARWGRDDGSLRGRRSVRTHPDRARYGVARPSDVWSTTRLRRPRDTEQAQSSAELRPLVRAGDFDVVGSQVHTSRALVPWRFASPLRRKLTLERNGCRYQSPRGEGAAAG